ncbi:MAG TPA: DUF1330 domain-containing protein [Stellaceae bacterium]|jgi:uncharacterized protein (DUF1330 family)
MSAYFIIELDVHDTELFERYRPIATETIARFGGRYLVRGGAVETIEGGWSPQRVVVLEFPTAERAKAWYHSDDYAEGLRLRQAAADSRVILVEGVPPS